jgi:hypothetical protein
MSMRKKPQSNTYHQGGTKPPADNRAQDVPPTQATPDDEAGSDSATQRPETPSPLDPAIGRIP